MNLNTKETTIKKLENIFSIQNFKSNSARAFLEVADEYCFKEYNKSSKLKIKKVPILIHKRINTPLLVRACLFDECFDSFMNSIGVKYNCVKEKEALNIGFESFLEIKLFEKTFYTPIVRVVDDNLYKEHLFVVLDIRSTNVDDLIRTNWKKDYLKSKTNDIVLKNLIDKISIDTIDASFKDILL